MKVLRMFFAVLLSLMCCVGASEAAITIKIAHPNVPSHPMGQGYELFKKDLEERSKGAFKVIIYDSSKFGNFDAVVQGISMGVLQMGSDGVGNFSVFNPKLMLFDLPFVIPSYEAADKITDGPIGQALLDCLDKNNIMGLGYIEIGFKNIFSSRPIRKLEDAKDLKIRSTHSKAHIALLQSLGMNPTPVAWGEVYTALQQKTVDGIDIDLNLAYFNKFAEITKYVTLTRSVYSPHFVMFSKKLWQNLTPEQQQWVRESFAVMQKFEREEIRKNEAMIIEKIKEMGGEVIELSPEEKARWVEASMGVFAQFADSVPPAVVEEMRNTVK